MKKLGKFFTISLAGSILGSFIALISITRRRDTHLPISSGNMRSADLVGSVSEKVDLYFLDYPLHEYLGSRHLEIISLLITNKVKGINFIEPNLIDEEIWGHKINVDYVRKERTAKISDINDALSSHPFNFHKESFIIKRKSLDDGRRIEYGLNPVIHIDVEIAN